MTDSKNTLDSQSMPIDSKYLRAKKDKKAMVSVAVRKDALSLLRSKQLNLTAICTDALDGVYLSNIELSDTVRRRRKAKEVLKDQYTVLTFRYSISKREALVLRGHNITEICRGALDRVYKDILKENRK